MTGERVRVIIDTDIGGDPDDALALALAAASPEIIIEGITTVYDDVCYHARRVAKVLELAGAPRHPIYNGASRTLLRNRKPPWSRVADASEDEGEQDALDGGPQPVNAGRAVDYIIRTIMDHPGEITLICIGPLTNIAAAIIVEPLVIEYVKEIVIMGGVVRLGADGADMPLTEHNVTCDPEAASIVFGSGAPILMIGLDVTRKATIGHRECEQLVASGQPLNIALADVIGRWLYRIGESSTAMHDPLTIASVIDRSLLTTRRMKIEVLYDHREGTGQTAAIPDNDGTVEVALNVDAPRFLDLLFDRLCKRKGADEGDDKP